MKQTDDRYIERDSPGMNDDPSQIADHLIGQHGVDGALDAVREGVEAAKENGDNYRLSVWREVRWVLQAKKEAADNHETPSV